MNIELSCSTPVAHWLSSLLLVLCWRKYANVLHEYGIKLTVHWSSSCKQFAHHICTSLTKWLWHKYANVLHEYGINLTAHWSSSCRQFAHHICTSLTKWRPPMLRSFMAVSGRRTLLLQHSTAVLLDVGGSSVSSRFGRFFVPNIIIINTKVKVWWWFSVVVMSKALQ